MRCFFSALTILHSTSHFCWKWYSIEKIVQLGTQINQLIHKNIKLDSQISNHALHLLHRTLLYGPSYCLFLRWNHLLEMFESTSKSKWANVDSNHSKAGYSLDSNPVGIWIANLFSIWMVRTCCIVKWFGIQVTDWKVNFKFGIQAMAWLSN